MSRIVLAALLLFGWVSFAHAETLRFTSAEQRVTLLELFTSEGCSSCPPADRWLSRLENDPRLWHQFVPVAFHVDYWDHLGWRDRYAQARFSARQRRYAHTSAVGTVYTPGFVRNGREWRGFFGAGRLEVDDHKAGTLTVAIDGDTLDATFDPRAEVDTALRLHVALLGFDIRSQVRAGENRGRTLEHNFVVLELSSAVDSPSRGRFQWSLPAPERDDQPSARLAIAAWVSGADELTPLQATGGWL